MVFHSIPSGKKKSSIGRKHKKGSTYASFQNPLPDGESNHAEAEGGIQHIDPILNTIKPSSKVRSDDSWRTNRAVEAGKKAVVKAKAKNKSLLTKNNSLKSSLNKFQSRVKQLEHERYMDKKEARATTIIAKKAHQVAMSDQTEKFCEELEGGVDG